MQLNIHTVQEWLLGVKNQINFNLKVCSLGEFEATMFITL